MDGNVQRDKQNAEAEILTPVTDAVSTAFANGAVREILGVPPSAKLPKDKQNPQQFFSQAAESTGKTFPGLVARDFLNEASKVSLFLESNPDWTHRVLRPALNQIQRVVFSDKHEHLPPLPVQIRGEAVVTGGSQPGPSNEPVADRHYQMTVGGAERTYTVHIPKGYDGKTARPLLIALHGHGQSGDILAQSTNLRELSDREGFIAVFPDGTKWAGQERWRAWDTGNGLIPPGSKADDISFLSALIEKSQSDFRVDPKRIYMAGLSNGGMMAFRAAGDVSGKVAAIAAVSAAMSGKEPPLKHPLSVLNIHGTNDVLVPYDGLKNVPSSLTGFNFPRFKSVDYATKFWAEQNKISGDGTVTLSDGIMERRFVNPANKIEVTEVTIHGGGHIPRDFDAVTGRVWDFFKAHPKVDGPTSRTPQPPLDEPFDILSRVKQHALSRGVHGLELDAGKVIAHIPELAQGSFSPSQALKDFETHSGMHLQGEFADWTRATSNVVQDGSRLSVQLDQPKTITLNSQTWLTLDNPSASITNENGLPALHNIDGVAVHLGKLNRSFDMPITEIAQRVDSKGVPFYAVTAENPLPSWMRTVMLASKKIPVELQLDDSGHAQLRNQTAIRDSVLGFNPVARGFLDFGEHGYELFNKPSVASVANFGKDALIFGGATWGAYALAGLKFGTKGRIAMAAAAGTVIAPSLIHGIERLID